VRLRVLVGWLIVLGAWVCAAPGAARAGQREFLRLERVDVEPWFDGLARVRAWLSVMELDGRTIDQVRPDELQLVIGSAKKPDVPWVTPWDKTDDELHVVVLVEIGTPYADTIDYLEKVGPEFLKKLPKHAKIAVMGYGSKVRRGKLGDLRAAQRAWKKLQAEDVEDAELQLAKGVDAAVKLLAAAQPERPRNSVRRLIVLISDGIEGNGEYYTEIKTADGIVPDPEQAEKRAEMRKRLKKVIKAAQDADVAIHAIAFSAYENRYPMRNLGQLTLKTEGTLRLARDREMIEGQLNNLSEEIKKQRVLAFYLPAEAVVAGQAASIWCKSAQCGAELPLKSNARKLPASRCAGVECAGGQVCMATCMTLESSGGAGWLFWVLGIVGVGALGAGGLALKRRREQQPAPFPAALGVAPGVAPAPGPATGMRAAVGAPAPTGAHRVAPHAAPAAPQARAPAPAVGAAPIGWLLFLSGPRQGQNIPVRHGFNIGKAPGNDLMIDDGFTSGRHAQIQLDAQGPLIVDVGSTNGTFVNGVHTMNARLVHGTSVRIGQTELRFLKG
jgi:hypothetical protein